MISYLIISAVALAAKAKLGVPEFTWAQKGGNVWITVKTSGVEKSKVEVLVADDAIQFRATDQKKKKFGLDLDLFANIDSDSSEWAVEGGRNVLITLNKATPDQRWKRLLQKADSYKKQLSIDWSRWEENDGDDEAEEEYVDEEPLEQMNDEEDADMEFAQQQEPEPQQQTASAGRWTVETLDGKDVSCSVCETLVDEMMKEVKVKSKSTEYKMEQRPQAKARAAKITGISELVIVDVLEDMCEPEKFQKYMLAERMQEVTPTHKVKEYYFANKKLKKNKKAKASPVAKDAPSILRTACNSMFTDYEDKVTEVLKATAEKEEVTKALCVGILQSCRNEEEDYDALDDPELDDPEFDEDPKKEL